MVPEYFLGYYSELLFGDPKVMKTTARLVLALALASLSASAQIAAPPPSAPAQRSAAELEKLVAPIALYADPLIATILPASVYPLEIVQAARFVADTNNLAKLDSQPWDDNVKAVARVPAVIKLMNDDLQWTMALGEAFLAQDKDVLDMIQTLRGKAQKAGTLQTTEQQIVVVTNTIVQSTVEQRVVVVTNTIVQIQPANPQVVYVPTYNPYTVYYPPPAYVYNPYAPLVTFGVGVAVGAAIAHNSCDYHSGSVYVGHHGAVYVSGSGSYHGSNVHVDHNTTVNNYNSANIDRNNTVNNSGNRGNQATPYNKAGTTDSPQKWQPDQKRMSSTSRGGTANTTEARGWGSSSGARPSTQPSSPSRPPTLSGSAGARPSTGDVGARPSTGNVTTRPTTTPSPATRSASPAPTSRPASPSPSARPSSTSTSGGGSAFGGLSSGSSSRSFSSRGSSSRSSGGGGRSGGGRSGGGRR